MPVSTPIRNAQPQMLESYSPPAVIRHAGELQVRYYNKTGNTLLQGEPVLIGDRIGLCAAVILPNETGEVILDWVADFRVDPALAANILANDQVWWSYDVTTVVAGVGGAVRTVPTNGFLLGRASTDGRIPARVDGSNKSICAAAGDMYVRVVNQEAAAVAIGTVPAFN